MTEKRLDRTLNYGRFGYRKTETEPSDSFLQTPDIKQHVTLNNNL